MVLSSLFLMFALFGCGETQTDGVNFSGDVSKLRTETVKNGDISYSVQSAGTLVPARLTTLSFYRVNGPLIGIYIEPNERITKGQLLAELDPEELRLRIASSELQKTIWELNGEIRQKQMLSYTRDLELKKMALEQAENNYDVDETSENDYKLKQANIQYEQSLIAQEIAQLSRQIFDIEHQIFDNNSTALQEQEKGSRLYAKNNGFVVSVEQINPGEEVSSGKQIAKLAEEQSLVVELKTTGAPYLSNQKEVTITVGDIAYAGQVYNPQPGDDIWKANAAASSDTVYVSFSGEVPPLMLSEKQPMTIAVNKTQVPMVSKKSIRNVNGMTVVDLIANDILQSVPVVCGVDNGTEIEIVSGLKEGDIISVE